MSTAAVRARSVQILEEATPEQRSRQRYPLELPVKYRLLGKKERRGSGKTRNISSNGVLFDVGEPLPVSGSIELTVSWPCLLGGVCPLKLMMTGRIVRSDDKGIAIVSKQHEFRTAGPANGSKRRPSKSQSFTP
jgi:hypothetical protein